jgi:hypothetical protein
MSKIRKTPGFGGVVGTPVPLWSFVVELASQTEDVAEYLHLTIPPCFDQMTQKKNTNQLMIVIRREEENSQGG